MNLHAVASAAISAINPMSQVGVLVSTGSTDNDDGSRTPTYNPPKLVSAQLQSLQYSDVMKLAGLNIQNVREKIYLSGDLEGLIRIDRRGGDLVIFPDGSTYIVAIILENWPDWTCAAVTQQIDPLRFMLSDTPSLTFTLPGNSGMRLLGWD
jgi:hypothetical protein